MNATCLVCTLKRSPTADEREWSAETGKTAARNLLRTAHALR
jgi:hypothetical protein